jgi:hypothetical protein
MTQLTWPFILRTFKRMDMIASRIDPEALAKEILAHHPKARFPSEYLSDVWQCMLKHAKAAGVDLYAHPNGNCPECGNAIARNHNGARYCSTACRQRAYRVRKAAAHGRNSPIPKRSREGKERSRRREAEAAGKRFREQMEAASAAATVAFNATFERPPTHDET